MTINEWDERADDWDTNLSTSVYADKAYNELTQAVRLNGQRVFDFGCGTGLLTERLSSGVKEIVALDSSPKMIERLKQKTLPNVFPIANFLTRSVVENNTLLRQKFDLITASSVCAFLPDYEGTLSLLRSLMMPNGVYVQWDWLSTSENTEDGFTERRVKQALTDTGFKNISISQPFEMGVAPDILTVLMAVAK
ncbi:MAG: class I SAM-dependent methyltransferase [Alphaproteobacteria bacterium]|nr:class I SAM-dependent methyltransferase [Alphaproteobacteria bacterium]